MTEANKAWRKALKEPKGTPNKYGARKRTVDGIVFHSEKEANRYCELKLLVKGGVIWNLKLQVRYDFIINEKFVGLYTADFVYRDKTKGVNDLVVEDCKGMRTPLYQFKKKLLKATHGITIFET